MKLNIENIFFIDGVGALFSFLGTGFLFPFFTRELGIPVQTFYILAVFPLIYGLYSFVCHFAVSQKKRWMLMFIMMANLFYCLLSGAILIAANDVTPIGYALITGEILIIIGVVLVEYKIYKDVR